jgi:hypothetical protein
MCTEDAFMPKSFSRTTTLGATTPTFGVMQPTLLTEIPLRLDKPDPGRCTECKMPRRSLKKVASRRRPAKRR